jgi:hypothetical protein
LDKARGLALEAHIFCLFCVETKVSMTVPVMTHVQTQVINTQGNFEFKFDLHNYRIVAIHFLFLGFQSGEKYVLLHSETVPGQSLFTRKMLKSMISPDFIYIHVEFA